MNKWVEVLNSFILQSYTSDLKTSLYPKDFQGLRTKVSFGMGAPARVPWIAFITEEMEVSKGFYPVYLFYKDINMLILSYGISETEEYGNTWPIDIVSSSQTITQFLGHKVPRYGDSFVYKAYKIQTNSEKVVSYLTFENNTPISEESLNNDLDEILNFYKKIVENDSEKLIPEISHGLFYLEKQLEDFIIHNWDKTELGNRFDLILKDGELQSQQYRTDIGPIDILAKDKKTGNFIVIELKKNQTSDDTAGQLSRYMGWVKKHLGDSNVRGIIIAGQIDAKLEYAISMIPNTEVFIYEIDFRLKPTK
jgi:hypothetical protein